MSAIAGIYSLDGRPVNPGQLRRMLDGAVHRGPDAEGLWHSGPIGIGHRMLRTTPESLAEQQPLANEDNSLVLTADARVDNREELEADLTSHGLRLRSDTDAELILRAYERWGEECPAHILGDFAFAIWDARRRRLFCARDPLGVKPFHYYKDDRRFVWASEPRQILADATVPLAPNLRSIGLMLLRRGMDRDQTLYRDIHRLPPAHVMVVEQSGVCRRCYWDLDPARQIHYQTDAEYADHFRSLFDEAVRCRLRSVGPVAATLSGGLDSSSIVCVAQELYRRGRATGEGINTYSIVFDGLPCDEGQYIRAVVEKHALRSGVVSFTHAADALRIERALEYPDVLYDPTTYACFPLLRCARRSGARVCLWGIGGDEVLTDGPSHASTLLRYGRIGPLVTHLRQTASACRIPFWQLAWRLSIRPLIPNVVKTPVRRLRGTRTSGGTPSWISAHFVRTAGLSQPVAPPCDKRFRCASQRQLYELLVLRNQADTLLAHLDAMASAHAMDFRHPFLDRRLVEFVMQVPDRAKIGSGQTRALLRNAAQEALPGAVHRRTSKSEFTHANGWTLRAQALSLRRVLNQSKLVQMGIVDHEEILRMLDRHCEEVSAGDRATIHRRCSAIWPVIRVEMWLESIAALEKGERVHVGARKAG